MIGENLIRRAVLMALLYLSCGPAFAGRSMPEAPARLPQVSSFALPHGSTKAPWGWADFCMRHHDECDVAALKPEPVILTPSLWSQIEMINHSVNASIREADDREVFGVIERWDYPSSGVGDCEDFALLKRKELIEAGIPRQALLMTVVTDENGAGHAVLTLRSNRGDFVLDNRTDKILGWQSTNYVFVKMQSEQHPNEWQKIGDPSNATLTASGQN
ncbi:MAG: transglutaminase-like cysteine peptidase [Hyphomicrobiales bacterium]|nr:transglutaminase-like cysteine peptidase [Hyphomicrobiales bacterium]